MGSKQAHSHSTWRWPIVGGVIAGSLDMIFAAGFWHYTHAVPPVRILQSIAAGLLGRASFEGGAATAGLGLGLHYFIAIVMALVYYLAARRMQALVARAWRFGALYGLWLYAVMTYAVVPLSAAPPASFNPAWVLSSVAMHVVIGILCALFARRALR